MKESQYESMFLKKTSLTPEEIRGLMRLAFYSNKLNNKIDFNLLVPKNWKFAELKEEQYIGGLVKRFIPELNLNARIDVYRNFLIRECNPSEWIENELTANGHEIILSRKSNSIVGIVSDLLTRCVMTNTTHIVRTTMVKDAAQLFRVECWATEELYPQLAEIFLLALASFSLTFPQNLPVAEKLNSFSGLYPAIFTFKYPSSWTDNVEASLSSECKVKFENFFENKNNGTLFINIAKTRYKKAEKVLEDFFLQRNNDGYLIENHLTKLSDITKGSQTNSSFDLMIKNRKGNPLEMRCNLVSEKDYSVLLGLISPLRESSPNWWSVNKRCFEIVRDSFVIS